MCDKRVKTGPRQDAAGCRRGLQAGARRLCAWMLKAGGKINVPADAFRNLREHLFLSDTTRTLAASTQPPQEVNDQQPWKHGNHPLSLGETRSLVNVRLGLGPSTEGGKHSLCPGERKGTGENHTIRNNKGLRGIMGWGDLGAIPSKKNDRHVIFDVVLAECNRRGK